MNTLSQKELIKIGSDLKKARKMKYKTQEDFAIVLGKALLNAGLSKRADYSSRQYQKFEAGEFPILKSGIVKIIDEILGTNIYKKLYEQNVPNNLEAINENKVSVEDEKKVLNPNEFVEPSPMQVILKLAESNDKIRNDNSELIATNKIIATANLKLASSNEELVQMAKDSIANVGEETPAIAQPILSSLLGFLFEIGSGKRWHSEEEMQAVWNKRVAEQMGLMKQEGTQNGSDKRRNVKS